MAPFFCNLLILFEVFILQSTLKEKKKKQPTNKQNKKRQKKLLQQSTTSKLIESTYLNIYVQHLIVYEIKLFILINVSHLLIWWENLSTDLQQSDTQRYTSLTCCNSFE